MTERQLTVKFVGKDAGLSSKATASKNAIAGLGQNFQTTAKQSQFLVDAQGRLKNAQGQFVDATKLSGTELSKLRKELADSGQDVALFDQKLKETRQSLLAFAGVSGGVGAAVAGIFQRGTDEFLAFEGGIKQAGVVGGASAEQLGVLREEVERLGIVTSKAPAEIAQTSVSLSRAGFSADEATDALEGVVRASEATGESLATVGDITSKTVRTFGLAASEAGSVGDILVATANNTNTTVSSIGESLSYVGAVAKASNQPLEDVAIAIGLLGDAGIQGSSAGTGLVAALDGLKQASAGAKSEFTDLVKGNAKRVEAFELLQTEVRNADGSMKSLIEILPVMKQNLQSLSQEDQDIVSKALFGVQGGRTIQTLLNTTDERLQQVTQTIRNAEGQATASGEGMLQGLGGALALLEGSVGATLIKLGQLSAIGLEPLVLGATAVLNGFLALPGPIQTVIVGTTAFVGVLAAAIAALTTYNALQLADKAAKIASAGASAIKTAAQVADTVATVASTTATAVMNASLSRQNILLGLNTVATNGAAVAKQAYAVATSSAGAASAAFAGKLALLAGQAALVVAALYSVSQVFKRSEGAEFAKELNESVEALERTRAASDEAKESFSGTRLEYSKFLDNIRDRGPIEAVQIALTELTGTADGFGKQWQIITREQRGAQLAQFATEKALNQLGGTVQDTSDLLAKYGQALPNGRQLAGAELEEFTKAIADQSKTLQEEIEVLEAAKGQSEENDQQLQNEIATRERLIRVLQAREQAQTGETSAVGAATDAARELSTVLDELSDKYDQLNDSASLTIDRTLTDIANQEAEGLISQAEAERKTVEYERLQLQGEIDNNQALLQELEAQRSQRTGEEREALNAEIFKAEQDLAQNQRRLAEQRAQDRRDENREAEKEAEEAVKAQEKIAKEAAEKRADALKQQYDDESRIREQAFGDRQREETDTFEQARDNDQDAFDNQRRALEQQFNDQQRAEAAKFERELQQREEDFNAKQRAAEESFNAVERDRTEQFNKRQQTDVRAFNDRLQAASEAFSDQQAAQREAAEGQFAKRRQEIERQLQLEATDPEDRAELEAKFKEEDATAERRRQAFAALEAQEKAFEAQQQAEKQAFEEQQRAEKAAFEEQQRQIQSAFEEKQRQIQEVFEEKQAEAKREREAQEEARQAKIEAVRLEEKRAFEEELRNLDRQFEAEQEALKSAFEEAQRQAERAFNDEQRTLDRENAAAVRAILDGASSGTAPTQSLRSGGVAQGGVVQVHRDEFLIPPQGTRVVSQQESRRLVQEFLIQNPLTRPISGNVSVPSAIAPDYSGLAEKLDTLIGAVRLQRRPQLKTGGDTYYISGQENPMASAQKARLDSLRSLVRLNR